MIIGIDIGGTTTKLVGYLDNKLLRPLTVKADDPVASAAGALGKFLAEEDISLTQISHIAVTGVGAGHIGDHLLGLPVYHIQEFDAIGRGGTFLANTPKAIVVSMGTGTALVEVDGQMMTHWGGTGIGGGTLVGLSKRLLGMTDIFLVCRKAQEGRLNYVDLSVGDITTEDLPGLPHSTTASNFGKCLDDATDADVALALLNLIYQTVGVVAHGAARSTGNTTIIITGNLATLPQAQGMFADLSSLFQISFTIPKNAAYATAIGAALLATERRAREHKSKGITTEKLDS
ncbi:type II pantothenate kinase [candidate division KSB3 bacterium]|uniref:Type II pantothenate kinase n=1 Tax=candidate division KSB3 bacterium TaxID=2044937 RepID=A0A2G6KHV2_9BACT|nr:MAG: type II pantothenate kinase [candidate division KSB3 bacterium]